MTDTSNRDDSMDTRATDDQQSDSVRPGRATLQTVDFDVTAGFGDDAPAAAEFIDVTQGVEAAATSAGSDGAAAAPDKTEESAPPTPAIGASSVPPPVSASSGSRRVWLGGIAVVVFIVALWFALR